MLPVNKKQSNPAKILVAFILIIGSFQVSAQSDVRILELTYGYYDGQSGMGFLEIPAVTTSMICADRYSMRLNGLSVIFQDNGMLSDVQFGMGIGFVPFKSILHINFDASLSYGISGWNNFSGFIKPHVQLHLPVHTGELFQLQVLLGTGFYRRFSDRLLGYAGGSTFYTDSGGIFFQIGGAAKVSSK